MTQMQIAADQLGLPLRRMGCWSAQAVAAGIEADWRSLHVCQSQEGTADSQAVNIDLVAGLRHLNSWQQMDHWSEALMSQSLLWVSP